MNESSREGGSYDGGGSCEGASPSSAAARRDKLERRGRPYSSERLVASARGRDPAHPVGRPIDQCVVGDTADRRSPVLGIAVAQQLRTMPGVQEFIARYPGVTPSSEAVYSGFPLWLRLLHFFNFFLMMFIIRAGSRFSPIIRAFIGGGTARPARIGSASSMTFRKTGYGRRKTIP